MQKFLLAFLLLCLPVLGYADEGGHAVAWLKLLHYQKSGNGYVSAV
jgi:hypothetical protein